MITVLSADKELHTLLHSNKSQGYVHSVYEKVINIMMDGKIIAVCISSMEPSPDAVITDHTQSFDNLGIAAEDACYVKGHTLVMGRTVIETSLYTEYDLSQVTMLSNDRNDLNQLLVQSENLVKIYGKKSEMYDAYFFHDMQNVMAQMMADTIMDIKNASLTGDNSKMLHSLMGIMGLGIGLTPSGDDFIAGMCLVLVNYDIGLKIALMQEYEDSKNDTGIISRQMIVNAINNKARRSEKELIKVYMNSDSKNIKEYVHQVLQFGSSSGTDTMCGIMTALYYIINFGKEVRT